MNNCNNAYLFQISIMLLLGPAICFRPVSRRTHVHYYYYIITYIYYALLSSVMFSNTRMNLKREAVYD